jgi:hypothetical protein
MRMATVVVLSLMWAGGAFAQGQGAAVLVPCLPPACLVLQPPRPARPVSDILPGSQIVPPQLVPYTPPKFAVQPIAPPSPVSPAPSSAYVPLQPIQFVPQPMVIPQVTPPDTSWMNLVPQPNAIGAMTATAELMRRRALAASQIQLMQAQTAAIQQQTEALRLRNEQLQEQLAEQQKQAQWVQKLQAARIAHPDWDEVANRPEVKAMALQPGVDALIKVIGNGPDVLYYLATEPEAYNKLKNMTEDQQLAEAWRISHLLQVGAN